MRVLVKVAICAVSIEQANLPKVLNSGTSGWAVIAGYPSVHTDALAPEIAIASPPARACGRSAETITCPGPEIIITPEPAEGFEEI